MAFCPSKRKRDEFDSITDVYDELINLYEVAKNEGYNVGEAIYSQSFHFVDHELLLDTHSQNRIKEYQFCKTFSCPPYPSLQETPANTIDDFFIIEEEFNHCIEKKQKDNKDA